MCAINVLFNMESDKLSDYLSDAWDILKFRGEDGYGIVGQIENKIVIIKSQDKDKVLNKIKGLNSEFKWVIAHNRKASVGSVNLDLTHPIVHESEKLIVVHNGTNKDLYRVVLNAKSDTDAILYVYSLIRDPLQINELVHSVGVYFIVDIERKKILFYRDDLRTLYIEKKSGVLCSEPIFSGEWSLVKEQLLYVDINVFSPESFDREKVKKLTFEKMGVCYVCNKRKPITKDGRCGDCYYNNKIRRVSSTVSSYSNNSVYSFYHYY